MNEKLMAARHAEIARQGSEIFASLLAPYLRGAEGENADDEQDSAAPGQAPDPQQSDDKPDAKETDEKGNFTEAYVNQLRRENAAHRRKNKDQTEAEAERRRNEMDEITRLRTENEESKTAREASDNALKTTRFENALLLEATKAGFRDPQDAIVHIKPEDEHFLASGLVDSAAASKSVKDLLKAKPYLKSGADTGSGDGGAQGGGAPKVDKVAEYQKQLQKNKGMVPIPS